MVGFEVVVMRGWVVNMMGCLYDYYTGRMGRAVGSLAFVGIWRKYVMDFSSYEVQLYMIGNPGEAGI